MTLAGNTLKRARNAYTGVALFIAIAPTMSLLTACSTPGERAETRQETRVEGRTEERQEQRRGYD